MLVSVGLSSGLYPMDLAKEQECFIKVLVQEAQGEPAEGVKAVATVLVNRRLHDKYPSSYCSIALQPRQFSSAEKYIKTNYCQCLYLGLKHPYAALKPKVSTLVYTLANKAVLGYFDAYGSFGYPRNMLWFHSGIKPVWAKKMKFYARIGAHSFYTN